MDDAFAAENVLAFLHSILATTLLAHLHNPH